MERLAARATECLGQSDGAGSGNAAHRPPQHFQSWSVNQFLTSVANIIEELEIVPGVVDTCVNCGCPKEPLNASHGDSSAMFDEVLEVKVV